MPFCCLDGSSRAIGRLMRHFKGKVPLWFRGDSTLLDYIGSSGEELKKRKGDKKVAGEEWGNRTVRKRGREDVKKGVGRVDETSQLINYSTTQTYINSSIQQSSFLNPLKQWLKYKIRQLILTHVYGFVDKAFYVGSNNKAYYLAHGLKERQLVFAPHAIDNERFFDSEVNQYEYKALQWRRELGFDDDDFVVLFCGKFETKKNPLLLWNAIEKLRKAKPQIPIKALFIGNGHLEGELLKRNNQTLDAKFLPFQNQSQMPLVYRMANLFCLPSQGPEETWGLAVNEAMACGRLVIVSDKVGCAIDLATKPPHHLFRSGNMDDLMEKITLAYEAENKSNAQQIAEQIKPWSFNAIAETLNKELLSGREEKRK
jgi:glycosyltransferase involved in cell wall biosynthesis